MLCLAEALLRIPDAPTADALIGDTFTTGNWKQHLGASDSAMVNASTWGLMLTGQVLKLDAGESLAGWFGALIKRSGEPVIRQALRAGMKFIGGQFVMGETIGEALENAREAERNGYAMSYDILGEGARTDTQAQGYIDAYLAAIQEISAGSTQRELYARPGISVKLSALHPRYSATQEGRVFAELLPRLKSILREAARVNIAVSIDAEEANRLDLELALYRDLLSDPEFRDFEGLGFVLQSYQKRAVPIVALLRELAKGRRIPVRLVKGAYWDSEIKSAQVAGLCGYPVFTRKAYTDLSYLVCAQALLEAGDGIYPQFATHNALTAATIVELAKAHGRPAAGLEFQRLHGMGESLHDQLVKDHRCRIYAPVGAHKGPARLPHPPPAGERRQYVLRPFAARPRHTHRNADAKPHRGSAPTRRAAQSVDPPAARSLRAGAQEFARRRSRLPRPAPAAAERDRRRAARDRRSAEKTFPCRDDEVTGARAESRAVLGPHARLRTRRHPAPRGEPAGRKTPRIPRPRGGRRKKELQRRRRRVARSRRLLPLLCRAGGAGLRAAHPPRPDRREQPAQPARARRVPLHQPVEFPAGDLFGPGRRRARRRQRRAGQARRADAAHRARRHRRAARGRRAEGRGAAHPRQRLHRRQHAGRRPAHRRRLLHRLDRRRPHRRPHAGRSRRPPSSR